MFALPVIPNLAVRPVRFSKFDGKQVIYDRQMTILPG
jgi:hypothetical protein